MKISQKVLLPFALLLPIVALAEPLCPGGEVTDTWYGTGGSQCTAVIAVKFPPLVGGITGGLIGEASDGFGTHQGSALYSCEITVGTNPSAKWVRKTALCTASGGGPCTRSPCLEP